MRIGLGGIRAFHPVNGRKRGAAINQGPFPIGRAKRDCGNPAACRDRFNVPASRAHCSDAPRRSGLVIPAFQLLGLVRHRPKIQHGAGLVIDRVKQAALDNRHRFAAEIVVNVHHSSLLPYVCRRARAMRAGLALRLTLSRKARGIGLGGAAIERRAPELSPKASWR